MTTALYLRLSIADGDLGKDGKDESNSIENQRDLLEEYIRKREDLAGEVVEYVDDGYSGTRFDRPAFVRMIEDAKRKRFQTIIVKDLSRLGRDYIIVGDYIDQIFPTLGVRFIAVNSNYDSNNYIGKTLGLDMTVSNLVNTLYSRDLSKKIKSSIVSKWKQGKTTCGNPPYGFVKDDNARGTWAIDPEAAKIIKWIFEMACDGYNTKMIVNKLNGKGIPTPAKYRLMNGRSPGPIKTVDSEVLWTTTKIRDILRRYEYTGAFVHNKKVIIRTGSKETRTTSNSERVVIEEAHDAIITKDEFYKAQEVIQKHGPYAMRVPNSYLLKGKIRCGNCKLALAYGSTLYEPFFYCAHAMNTGDLCGCCKDYYSEQKIESVALAAVKEQMRIVKAVCENTGQNSDQRKSDRLKMIRDMKRRREVKQEDIANLYISYAEGFISLDSFNERKKRLTGEIKALESELAKMSSDITHESEVKDEIISLYNMADAILAEDKLTEQMVENLIEMIYVHDSDHIEVKLTFTDIIQEAVENSRKESEDEAC